jgi:hypothetical protein
MPNLILHAGGRNATVEEVEAVPIPQATRTYGVIPHGSYRQLLRDRMPEYGLYVEKEELALSNKGQRMFGLLLLKGEKPDYQLALGYRNSYDRSMVAGLVVGTRVFICDNLAFSGEKQMKVRHTLHATENLERGVPQLLGSIQSVIEWQDRFIETLKDWPLIGHDAARDEKVDEIVYSALRRKTLPAIRVQHAVQEWEKVGTEPTAWGFYNCFTHGMREISPDRLVLESKRLTSLFARTFSLPSLN